MDSDTARPGRRGGRHARGSRESSRSAGGLKLFSLKVVEKIRSRVRTNYNAVANELVNDQNMSGGSARDGKSIRRRCYDAINVLLACGLIKKDEKKQIVWRGHDKVEVDRLRTEIEKKEKEVENKQKLLQDTQQMLQDMERKRKALETLLALGESRRAEAQDSGCGSGDSPSACSIISQGGQRYTIPFMLVQAPAHAQVQLHSSEDKTQVQFEVTDAQPELHDDCSVVMRLQQHEAELQANRRSRRKRGRGPSQGTDSGQPTQAARVPQAADLTACDLSTPETLQHLPSVPPLTSQAEQEPQQRHCSAQVVPPQQQLHLPEIAQRPPQIKLHNQPPLPPPMLQQQQQQLASAQPSPPPLPLLPPHPHQQLQQELPLAPQQQQLLQQQTAQGPTALACRPLARHNGMSSATVRDDVDFLAHLKPVVTTRSKIWPRLQAPILPPLGAQLQARMGDSLAAAQNARPVGPSWEAVVAQPPPQPEALSLARPLHPPTLGFSPTGCLAPLFVARSLGEDLQQPQQPATCDGFHKQLVDATGCCGSSCGTVPADQQRDSCCGGLVQDTSHSMHYQHHKQQQSAVPGQMPPGSPTSLYAFEEMASEELPPPSATALLTFCAGAGDLSDPLAFVIGTSTPLSEQLAHLGWPYAASPEPFSPSALLGTPSYMKGCSCRPESSRHVNAVPVGVQQ